MNDPTKIKAYYNIFRQISNIINSSIEVEEVLELAVWKAAEAMGAKGAALRILNPENNQLKLSAHYGLSDRFFAKRPLSRPEMIVELYGQESIAVIRDIKNDPRIEYHKDLISEGVRMVMDIPLHFRSNVAGLLRLYFGVPREFDEDDQDFIKSLAEQCACAIDKVSLIRRQKNNYDHLAIHTEKLTRSRHTDLLSELFVEISKAIL